MCISLFLVQTIASCIGVLSFVVVNTLEDIGTALQLAVFFRIALKWPSVGALKIKQRHACNNGDANHAFHRKCRCQCGCVYSMVSYTVICCLRDNVLLYDTPACTDDFFLII